MSLKPTIGFILLVFSVTLVGFTVPLLESDASKLYEQVVERLIDEVPNRVLSNQELIVVIDPETQKLFLIQGKRLKATYPVSTSPFGTGNIAGSQQTPFGLHEVAEKIGEDVPFGTIFKFRRNTHEIAEIPSASKEHDYITTRILFLRGLEAGINQGEGIDSFERRIYIHGTADEKNIGTPTSRGCIRMMNKDVITLFKTIPAETLVLILNLSPPT